MLWSRAMPSPTDSLAATSAHAPTPSTLAALFTRVVQALERSFAFDHAELVLIDGADAVRRFIMREGEAVESREPRGDYSTRLWKTADALPRFVASGELDASKPADQRLIAAGMRSVAVVPLRNEATTTGVLILASTAPAAFDHSRGPILQPVAGFLAIALERERLWAIEEARHQRRVRLEAVLPRIAESLGGGRSFVELSGLLGDVIPHDVLALVRLLPDRTGVRVETSTHATVIEERVVSGALDADAWSFLIAYDLTIVGEVALRARVSPSAAPEVAEVDLEAWAAILAPAKVRSLIRLPIRSQDRPNGAVVFMAHAPDAYDEEDGIVASRVADQLALALAHQRLDEEQRRVAESEERAALLERRVDELTRDLARVSEGRAEAPVVGASLDSMERAALVAAMRKAEDDRSVAAERLGITRSRLASLLRKHGLTGKRS
jgi:GAF domain-containing protein